MWVFLNSLITSLGLMYLKGQGVLKNDKTAVKWFRLAAEQGNAQAQSNLGVMYFKGQGVVQDYVRAHMWSNIAASQGSKEGMQNRDILVKSMSSGELDAAQKLANECLRKKYKEC